MQLLMPVCMLTEFAAIPPVKIYPISKNNLNLIISSPVLSNRYCSLLCVLPAIKLNRH